MADAHKYQAHEVLNRVLNAGEDGLNVDLADSVTVTVTANFLQQLRLQIILLIQQLHQLCPCLWVMMVVHGIG